MTPRASRVLTGTAGRRQARTRPGTGRGQAGDRPGTGRGQSGDTLGQAGDRWSRQCHKASRVQGQRAMPPHTKWEPSCDLQLSCQGAGRRWKPWPPSFGPTTSGLPWALGAREAGSGSARSLFRSFASELNIQRPPPLGAPPSACLAPPLQLMTSYKPPPDVGSLPCLGSVGAGAASGSVLSLGGRRWPGTEGPRLWAEQRT